MASAFDPLIELWQSGNADRVADLFAPNATWMIDGESLIGDEIALAMKASLASRPHARIHMRRAFRDLREPQWWAAEWVMRSSSDGRDWAEIEQGLLMQVTADNRIEQLRTHNDHATVRPVQATTPLRSEAWPAGLPPRATTMLHDDVLATHYRHTREGWAKGNADNVVGCHAPGSLIQTSLEKVSGHANLRIAVAKYHENYCDTKIEVDRMVYSGEFLAISQTWHCTNRKTGVRNGDHDLNIGILQDGVLWRWREYYDSTKSAQTREQTAFGTPDQQQ